MVEICNVKFAQVRWILQCHNVLARKYFISQQLFPIFGFQIQLLNCLIGENIASCADGYNVRLVSKLLEQNWAVVLPFSILVKLQFEKLLTVQWLE